MRRALILTLALVMAVSALATVAMAAKIDGDNRANVLRGTPNADRMSGGGGGDLVFGYRGRDWLDGDSGGDVLKGDGGRDRIFGSAGQDRLKGGGGNDFLNAKDGIPGNDRVVCGDGFDTFTADGPPIGGDSIDPSCENPI